MMECQLKLGWKLLVNRWCIYTPFDHNKFEISAQLGVKKTLETNYWQHLSNQRWDLTKFRHLGS